MGDLAGDLVKSSVFDLDLDDAARFRLRTKEVLFPRLDRYDKVMAAGRVIAVPCGEVVWPRRHVQRREAIIF